MIIIHLFLIKKKKKKLKNLNNANQNKLNNFKY